MRTASRIIQTKQIDLKQHLSNPMSIAQPAAMSVFGKANHEVPRTQGNEVKLRSTREPAIEFFIECIAGLQVGSVRQRDRFRAR